MDHIYQDIPGWFDWQSTYQRWAEQVSNRGRIVEVGNYHGRSLAFLLVELARRQRNDVMVIGVDPFLGGEGIHDTPEQIEAAFHQTIARLGDVAQPLRHVKATSVEASRLYLDLTIDFVWIDGDHNFSSVLEDLECWWPKVALGGEIGGHDYAWQSVGDAVRLWCKARNVKHQIIASSDPNSGMPSWIIRK